MPAPGEMTAYYARVLRPISALGSTLSDILSHPSFDPDEINREKNVIVQEVAQSKFPTISC
jgi:predicted Zn-dependent peptidase